ncbi:hypothetical protein BO99DRAFT_124502 [Aspergillus violaceofuscus CBS 115571]|uniref:Uncharacterized protein n=1 Tax=Aspergillus violaceofuscus (strain CBS 115571) TaxID=1450538 RepID=A0A2V5HPK9_ASPV1|nr:hypothetical protein BO99DRAFT_124502 [Aspergillus violaceofuscus CBS 115571]
MTPSLLHCGLAVIGGCLSHKMRWLGRRRHGGWDQKTGRETSETRLHEQLLLGLVQFTHTLSLSPAALFLSLSLCSFLISRRHSLVYRYPHY